MKIEPRTYDLNGRSLVFRSAEKEEAFINSHTENEKACLILAELDGEYVGNASFDVAGGSRRNFHMYETFGFAEVGCIPKANKYDDGTYAADIHMVKSLN